MSNKGKADWVCCDPEPEQHLDATLGRQTYPEMDDLNIFEHALDVWWHGSHALLCPGCIKGLG